MNKTLAILLLLLPVGLVGCGENDDDSAKNAPQGLTIESLSGVYERDVDGMKFKRVIDKSGTFKDYFSNLFDDLSGSTFMEQAGGTCTIVEKEVHLHYQTPADLAESGRVQIFRVQQDGGLAVIAAILNGKRHELSEEQQQEETHVWLKRSDDVANKGFRIVKPKPMPTVSKEQEEAFLDLIDSSEGGEATDASEGSASSSDDASDVPSKNP